MKSIKKIRYISPISHDITSIFERDISGNYTKNALLYQDIIRYYFVINENPAENNHFRLRDLQKWIVLNNLEIIKHFQGSKAHTSLSNKIHAMEDKIRIKFNNLMEMDLIRQAATGVGEKVKVDIPLYSYTQGGILLALIIRNMSIKNMSLSDKDTDNIQNKKQELKDNVNRIYNVVYSSLPLGENYPYSNILYKTLLKNAIEKEVFDKLVGYMTYLCHTARNIRNMVELLERIYIFDFENKTDRTNFLNLLNETLDEQEPEVKDYINYQMKLSVQTKFEYIKRHLSMEYERERFRLRADHEKIVLEGNCERCQKLTIFVWSLNDYRKKRADLGYDGEIRLTCKHCGDKNSCIIPAF